METIKKYSKKALIQYEDLRDTITVIEAMKLQGTKPGVAWNTFKTKINARNN